jgi:acyl-CoA hydrolase
LVEDGATLQTGIGNIPDAVMDSLGGHRNLGLHTEMWSVGMMKLIKQGVVNNSKKSVYRGHSVSTFLVGNREMYDFVNDNPSIVQLEASYVNDPAVIRRNPKVTAINSAVEIDLTGQICADSVGSHIISGVGGQMDFIRGATLSEGGKPIIAITSRSKKGIPKIVPTLKAGAGVVTTRAHVHWVVTEYGACNLAGMTLAERARALISLAHPEDRDSLDRAWRSHA